MSSAWVYVHRTSARFVVAYYEAELGAHLHVRPRIQQLEARDELKQTSDVPIWVF